MTAPTVTELVAACALPAACVGPRLAALFGPNGPPPTDPADMNPAGIAVAEGSLAAMQWFVAAGATAADFAAPGGIPLAALVIANGIANFKWLCCNVSFTPADMYPVCGTYHQACRKGDLRTARWIVGRYGPPPPTLAAAIDADEAVPAIARAHAREAAGLT